MRFDELEARQLLSIEPISVVALADDAQHGGNDNHYIPPSRQLVDWNGFLSGPAAGEPLDIAIGYLTANAARLGLTVADLSSYEVTDLYSSTSGITHVYLRQTLGGLDVENAVINVNVTAGGSVINVGSSFVSGVTQQVSAFPIQPRLSAPQALAAAARALGISLASQPSSLMAPQGIGQSTQFSAPELSLDAIPVELTYVPNAQGGVDLAWNMVLRTPDGDHWFDLGVSADTGEIVFESNWVDDAVYNVLDIGLQNPDAGARAVQMDPHDPVASPFGWHDTNGVAGAEFTDTRGNNVSAQEDADDTDTGGFRPDGGAGLSFDFPIDPSQAPVSYASASVTQLFYLNNTLHDVFYRYGFTEAAGNFQVNNFGNAGVGNDAVQADAQDGSGLNNANMFTPPDGQQPRMQQFIFNLTNPNRDSDFENGIVIHEYGHGVSNRLTGGPANSNALDALQSAGMGEGWSDWWSLMFNQKASDTQLAGYTVATHVLGQPLSGSGIRRVPYSFDMTIDPLTYGAYNGGPALGFGNNEVHNSGEIWCSALWDLNWLLINKNGFSAAIEGGYTPGAAGNILALQLVMDGLKLQPANPTFLQARDAILAADTALTGGANHPEIWLAFARRGMGVSATDGGNADSPLVVEAFDTPPVAGTPTVVSTVPADGSTVLSGLTEILVNFSEPMNVLPGNLLPSDLTLGGPGLGSITVTAAEWVDLDTARFTLSGTWAEGVVTVRLVSGFPRDLTGTLLAPYAAGDFTIDAGTGDLDDQISEATPLTVGASVSRAISVLTDVDMFSVTVAAGDVLLFDVDYQPGLFDSFLRLFDASGTELLVNDDGRGSGFEKNSLESFLGVIFNTPGTYYVGVSGWPNTGYDPLTGGGDANGVAVGNYSLSVRAPAADIARPFVVSTSPADGSAMLNGPTEILVNFSEAMSQVAGNLIPSNLRLGGPGLGSITVAAANWLDSDTARFTLAGTWAVGQVTLQLLDGFPRDLAGNVLEDYTTDDFTVGFIPPLVVGPGPGQPEVRVFNTAGQLQRAFQPYPGFLGEVRVAAGDVNGDGIPDILTAVGSALGVGPHVKVFNGTDGAELFSFYAYGFGFNGGVFIAAGDVNNDGRDDIITGADAGAGPHVKVFSGLNGSELYSFYAYDQSFSGGVRVAGGDVDGDGNDDIVTGAGPGAGPHMKVFSGVNGSEFYSFYAYDPSFNGGVYVAAGDVDGDARADIITGAGAGAGPHVRVVSGLNLAELQSFYAYSPAFGGGVRVGAGDLDSDGRADIITGAGPGGGPHVRGLKGTTLADLSGFFGYPIAFAGGVFVAGFNMGGSQALQLADAPVKTNAADSLTQDQLELIRAVAIDRFAAAGGGWFIDPTPDTDEQFSIVRKGRAVASGSAVSVDLLTAVLHEPSHSLGLEHDHDSEGSNDLLLDELSIDLCRLLVDAALANW